MNEEENTQSMNYFASTARALLSAGVHSASPQVSTTFLQRFADAYNSVSDPMYTMKHKQGELMIAKAQSNLEAQSLDIDKAKQTISDSLEGKKEWMRYSDEWRTEGKSDPEWLVKNPYVGNSPMAKQEWEKAATTISINQNRQDLIKVRMDNSKLAVDNEKRASDWNNAVGAADPEVQSQIAELDDQGWILDKQGRRVAPSVQALSLLNQWRTDNGLTRFGASSAEVTAASREKITTQNIKAKFDLKATAQQNRIDLEKYKAELKTTAGGKVVSREEFIKGQFSSMYTDVYNGWNTKAYGPFTIKKAADMAQDILGQTYDKFASNPVAPAAAPVKTSSGKSFTVEPVNE